MTSPLLENLGGAHCGDPLDALHILRDRYGMAFRPLPDGSRELVYGCAICGRAWSVVQSAAEVQAMQDRVAACLQARLPPQGRQARP